MYSKYRAPAKVSVSGWPIYVGAIAVWLGFVYEAGCFEWFK